MSFKEAGLIIECRLMKITTANFSDFYLQEAKDLINEAYKEANAYRKLVFGEIIYIWVKNKNKPELTKRMISRSLRYCINYSIRKICSFYLGNVYIWFW